MDLIRIYLLAGLLLHKLVWEILKRRKPQLVGGARAAAPLHLTLIKAVKVAMLLGLIVQVVVGDVLPIASSPSALRFVGLALYTGGLAVAVVGRIQLGKNWSDIESAQIVGGHAVVSTGIYRFVRHPIYVGDLLMLLGFELCLNSWLVVAVLLLATIVLWKAVREEKALINHLPGYAAYCARTKRFIPFIV